MTQRQQVYDALMLLLAACDAAGDDEETVEIVENLLDRVWGYCRPAARIVFPDDKPQEPSE